MILTPGWLTWALSSGLISPPYSPCCKKFFLENHRSSQGKSSFNGLSQCHHKALRYHHLFPLCHQSSEGQSRPPANQLQQPKHIFRLLGHPKPAMLTFTSLIGKSTKHLLFHLIHGFKSQSLQKDGSLRQTFLNPSPTRPNGSTILGVNWGRLQKTDISSLPLKTLISSPLVLSALLHQH